MADITRRKKGKKAKKPQGVIKFGTPIRVPPIDVDKINEAIQQDRKFKDERIKRLRKQMFRRDI